MNFSRSPGASGVPAAPNSEIENKVISHTLELKDGTKKTVGTIAPGTYSFNTGAPERMDILAGSCKVKLAGQSTWKDYTAGQFFEVPGKSSFEITVQAGLMEYLCSFLQ